VTDREEKRERLNEPTRPLAALVPCVMDMTRSLALEPWLKPEDWAYQAVLELLIQVAEEGGAPAVRDLGAEQWELNDAYVVAADSGRIQAVKALLQAGAEFDCEKDWNGWLVPRCPICFQRRYGYPLVPDCGHCIAVSHNGGHSCGDWLTMDECMRELLDLCFGAAWWLEYCRNTLGFDALDQVPKRMFSLLQSLDVRACGGAGWFLTRQGAIPWYYDTWGFLCTGWAEDYFHPDGQEFAPRALENLRPAYDWLMARVAQGDSLATRFLEPSASEA